jgi:hypothetical protein
MGNLAEIFLCDECDCLATVSVSGDTITLQPCACITLDWETDNA